MKLFSTEQSDWIKNSAAGLGNAELTDKFNQTFGTSIEVAQIKSFKNNHNISSGLTGYFPKGNVPANKGKKMSADIYNKAKPTMFRKGNIPPNRIAIGAEKARADGYVWVKIQDGHLNKNWRLKHVLIWEKQNGPLPVGELVIFLDGNTRNFSIDNLKAINKATNARLNQNHLRYSEKELTEAGIAVAQLITTANKAKRRIGGKR